MQAIAWNGLGLLEQDAESAWLELDPAEDADAMPQILGSSISYRIAVGPQQGQKAFMIRTIHVLFSESASHEMTSQLTIEDYGRLTLWDVALIECASMLRLLDRCQHEIDSGRPQLRNGEWGEGPRAWEKTQPDYEPGTQKASHWSKSSQEHPEE